MRPCNSIMKSLMVAVIVPFLLQEALLEQEDPGFLGAPADPTEDRPRLMIRPGGPKGMWGEKAQLELEINRILGFLDAVNRSRKAIAEAAGLASTTSWEDLSGKVENLRREREVDQAAREELGANMSAIASALMDSFAVEERETELTAAPLGAELKSLVQISEKIALEAGSLHSLLEERKAEIQLQAVVELGSGAVRYLQDALRTTRSKGGGNEMFELIHEEVDWIILFTNRLEEQLASESGTIADLKAASDLLFTDDQETRSLPSALRIAAAIRVLRGYHSIWQAQPPEVQGSLTNAEKCIADMLSILGVGMHDKVRLLVEVGTLQKAQFSVSSDSRLLMDPLFQAEMGALFALQKITPGSTVIDISQLGFEVSGPSIQKKPWQSRLFVAERRDLERYSRLRG